MRYENRLYSLHHECAPSPEIATFVPLLVLHFLLQRQLQSLVSHFKHVSHIFIGAVVLQAGISEDCHEHRARRTACINANVLPKS